jgi:ABC-type multidrug transport system fused ATPase/permease subunit
MLVPQETYIFNDTLAFNLRVGKADASDEDLAKVLEAVQLTGLVAKLPEGIYSQVGDRDLLMSGGERQRIALARALLRGAQILVLDEGTSALDEMTEASVLKAIRPTCQNRIVITVAHRATAIAAADEVRLIQNGEASLVRQSPENVPGN